METVGVALCAVVYTLMLHYGACYHVVTAVDTDTRIPPFACYFAAGVLYLMVCGSLPFYDPKDAIAVVKVMDVEYDEPEHCSRNCVDLIAKLLVKDPVQSQLTTSASVGDTSRKVMCYVGNIRCLRKHVCCDFFCHCGMHVGDSCCLCGMHVGDSWHRLGGSLLKK